MPLERRDRASQVDELLGRHDGGRATSFDGPDRRAHGVEGAAPAVAQAHDCGVDALDEWWINDKARRVAAVTRDLGRIAGNGAAVQVLDVTEGGVHALWNLGLRQPTRFIYDFHFFHHTGDARIQALRAELVAGLRTAPPAAIVVLRDTWNRKGYDRFDEWPEIGRLLARDYRLAIDGDGYRIYVQRART